MLGTLSGPMHELAFEEQKDLKYKLAMIQHNGQKQEHLPLAFDHYAKETSGYA